MNRDTPYRLFMVVWIQTEKGIIDMGDKGKRDKGKKEQQKKALQSPKEKRKLKREKKK